MCEKVEKQLLKISEYDLQKYVYLVVGELAIFILSKICPCILWVYNLCVCVCVCVCNIELDLKSTPGHFLNMYLCNFYMPDLVLDVGGTNYYSLTLWNLKSIGRSKPGTRQLHTAW